MKKALLSLSISFVVLGLVACASTPTAPVTSSPIAPPGQVSISGKQFIRNGQPALLNLEAISGFFSKLQTTRAAQGETHHTQHHLTTLSVRVLDDTHAESVAYVLVARDIRKSATPLPSTPIPPLELLLEYWDSYVLHRGEWHICRHEVQQLFRAFRAAAPP